MPHRRNPSSATSDNPRRLFGSLFPAPHACECRNRTVLDREPKLLAPCPDLRFSKAREEDQPLLLGFRQYRVSERAGQIANIGNVLRHVGPRALSGQQQGYAPGHDIDKRATDLFTLPTDPSMAARPSAASSTKYIRAISATAHARPDYCPNGHTWAADCAAILSIAISDLC